MVALIDVEDEVEDPPVVLLEGDLGWLLSQGCGSRGEIGGAADPGRRRARGRWW